jgi:hypothetical protein
MTGRLLAALLICLPSATAAQGESGEGRPAPCLILHDWFGTSPVATPTYVRDHLEFLESQPFDGLALYLRTPDLKVNVTLSAMTDTPLSEEAIAGVLKPVARLKFRTLIHNFAAVLSHKPPDLFDDWSVPVKNFGALAKACRDAGLKGIYFDNENYTTKWADYPRAWRIPRRAWRSTRSRRACGEAADAGHGGGVSRHHRPVASRSLCLRAEGSVAPLSLLAALESPARSLLRRVRGRGREPGAHRRRRRALPPPQPEDFRRSYEWRKTVFASERTDCSYLPPRSAPNGPPASRSRSASTTAPSVATEWIPRP